MFLIIQNKLIREVEIGTEVNGKIVKKSLADAKERISCYMVNSLTTDNLVLAETQNDATKIYQIGELN